MYIARPDLRGDLEWQSNGTLVCVMTLALLIGVVRNNSTCLHLNLVGRLTDRHRLCGQVSGMLGLGGGELMAPLLLALGMLPQADNTDIESFRLDTPNIKLSFR